MFKRQNGQDGQDTSTRFSTKYKYAILLYNSY